jgi:hypothetical protein
MKFVPNALSRKVAMQGLLARKHSPQILFGAGVVGVVATTVMACKATLRLEEVLEEAQADITRINEESHSSYSDEDKKKDKAIVYVRSGVAVTKLYGPSILLGVASVSALAGSHHILSKRNAGLMAAYGVLEKGFNDYRARVRDELGDDKDKEFLYGSETVEVLKDGANGPKKSKVKVAHNPSVYAKFFDEFNKNWSHIPEYNFMFLRQQEIYFNQRLQAQGYLFLSDVYDDLGIDQTKESRVVGWLRNGDGNGYVDFGVFDGEGIERMHDFVTGRENAILLDFNVDGVIYDKF